MKPVMSNVGGIIADSQSGDIGKLSEPFTGHWRQVIQVSKLLLHLKVQEIADSYDRINERWALAVTCLPAANWQFICHIQ
jgi:hypothetical protein